MEAATLQNIADLHGAMKTLPSRGYDSLVKRDAKQHNSLSLLVGGVYCAACIQKIESALRTDPAVENARLNFSTGALTLTWAGSQDKADHFIDTIESLGYTVQPYSIEDERKNAADEDRQLLLCLGVAGFAMGNIMLLSIGLWTTSPEEMGVATRDFLHLISAFIAIPTVIFSGRPFFASALKALRARSTNMDVPISVGLILATGLSLYETFTHGEHAYFDSAVMLIFFLLIGRYLDFRARRLARSAAQDLVQGLQGFASIIENEKIRKIPVRDLQEGMNVLISSGEKFPADGIVESGESTVDTSLVTGETTPRDITPQSLVYAGTLNLSAPITMRVLKAAQDSLLADIVRLMEKAEQAQSRYVRLADRAAQLYTPVVHALALLAFVFWYGFMALSLQQSIMIAATVLIITCPCALGLAVPVVQVLAISRLMKNGVMVKSGDALERLAQIDTVIFDKTGTITHGKPVLINHANTKDFAIAASLAAHSKHVLAEALLKAYQGTLMPLESIREHAGQGMEAQYQGKTIRLGRATWCHAQSQNAEGPELWFVQTGEKSTRFSFSDTIRADAKTVVREMKESGLHTVLLSGDRDSEAVRVGDSVGTHEAFGEKTPAEKYEFLEHLKNQGHRILMVGDGLNDAPTLASAYVSMAPGTAIDLAQNVADIVFMGQNLFPVHLAYRVALKTQKLVRENFALAVIYNLIAIPVAFCGYVTPLIAALAMSGSSLLVVANSFRLRSVL